jgi:small subunit ribosomal protein S16
MVKIRLMRLGKRKQPYYRVVVADSRSPRDGRIIENIGKYHPRAHPSVIDIDEERAVHWLRNGAQPSDPVKVLLQKTGIWERFSGEAPPPPKPEKARKPEPEAPEPEPEAPEPEPEAVAEESTETPAEGETEAPAGEPEAKAGEPEAKAGEPEAEVAEAEAEEGKPEAEAEAEEGKA